MSACRLSAPEPPSSQWDSRLQKAQGGPLPASTVTCVEPRSIPCRKRRTGSVCTYTNLYFSHEHGWLFLRDENANPAGGWSKLHSWSRRFFRDPKKQQRLDVQLWSTETHQQSAMTQVSRTDRWAPTEVLSSSPQAEQMQSHQLRQHVSIPTFISQLWHNDWTQAVLDNAVHVYWSAAAGGATLHGEPPQPRPSGMAVFFDGQWIASRARRNRTFARDGHIVTPPLAKLGPAFFSPGACSGVALHPHATELQGALTRFSRVVAGGFERHMLLSRRVSGVARRKHYYECEGEETDATRARMVQRFRAYVLQSMQLPALTFGRPRLVLLLNRHAPARRIANSEAVVDALRRETRGWGDVQEYKETQVQPFRDLLVALRDCTLAIAPQGKAATNVLFMQPGALMAELMPEEDENAEIDHIANYVRVAHIGLPADVAVVTPRKLAKPRKRPLRDRTQLIANATQLGLIARYSRSAPDTRRGETLKPEAVDAFVARARLDLQIPARR